MKNAPTPLPKSVLIPLRLSAATLGTDAAVQKRFWIRRDSVNNVDFLLCFR